MSGTPAIAVIGLGCRYPGAATLREFWENVIARRCQFRRLPEVRFPLDEYYSEDRTAPDKTYASEAAVIDGFEFDWIGRGFPKPMFEASDIVHWLALEVALAALEDAGHAMAGDLDKERTGIVLGNTLTGEHTRANTMRLRWPFFEKTIRAAAQTKGLSPSVVEELAATTEQYFKSVFPPTTEDTLAGGLSNTISGRICGYLGLHGGGFTVDGACSSSLIAVATAATALVTGRLDTALAGGVDVSLDTFELIGFSKAGALAQGDLHVYDRRANGFKPGEGCGFVVLKRLEDAREHGDYVYAVLRGWGISSDGRRAITAPNAEGQARAIRRAYDMAGYGMRDLAFIEGHGTGTSVGDAIELEGISLAMNDEEPQARQCGVTSLKSVIGHTKAAAGIGGLIKAVLAANRRVLPPTANCTEPHAVFDDLARPLYPIMLGELRPGSEVLRVGVSAAGFGGINCHVTLESGDAPAQHVAPELDERAMLVSQQETEVFLLSGDSVPALTGRVEAVRRLAEGISEAEMVDLAAKLAGELEPNDTVRAACIAEKPSALQRDLGELARMLGQSPPLAGELISNPQQTIWLGAHVDRARVGYLFPGQGAQRLNMARTLVERHPWARELLDQATEWLRPFGLEGIKDLMYRPVDRVADAQELDTWTGELKRTEVAQPAICLASLLWERYLEQLGVKPVVVGGHSLGELSAFYAAGVYDQEKLLRLAAIRGRAMAAPVGEAGAMAALACPPEIASELVKGAQGDVVLANLNSFGQTVISGNAAAVKRTVQEASAGGIRAKILPVSNAFHSQYVSEAAQRLRAEETLDGVLQSLRTGLYTSTDGSQLTEGVSLADHFANQVVSQVHFIAMVASMYGQCDVFIEVGPGRGLTGLVESICGSDGPLCLPVESKPGRDRDLNTLMGSLFVRGANLNFPALYQRRLVREFVPAAERVFIDNPCERPLKGHGAVAAQPALGTGAMEAMLAEDTGVAQADLSEYLTRRRKFLAAIVRADFETVADWAPLALPPGLRPAEGATGAVRRGSPDPAGVEAGIMPVPPAAAMEVAAPTAEDMSETSIYGTLLEGIEDLTGFPPEAMLPEMRLIDDLNLDSIKAAELIASVSKRLGITGRIDPGKFANATLHEISGVLAHLVGGDEAGSMAAVSAAESRATPVWVRNFVVEHVPEEAAPSEPSPEAGDWAGETVLVLCERGEEEVAETVRRSIADQAAKADRRFFDTWPAERPGAYTAMVAILPRSPLSGEAGSQRLEQTIRRLRSVVAAARSEDSRPIRVAYVQFGGGDFGASLPNADVAQTCAKAVAASLYLENGHLKVRVLDFAPEVEPATLAKKITLELASPEPFAAVGYDAQLTRRVPKLRRSDPQTYRERGIEWSSDDVILVTGGAKGITAECALAVAEKTGVRMALVGSSPPPGDAHGEGKASEIVRTLERFAEKGLTARYYQCNVTDRQAVRDLAAQVEQELGPITGVVHGAAVNRPALLADVSTEDAFAEVAPKVLGAMNLCEALSAKPPKMFVGLSSVIGVSGMWRNGWYGFSNEALDRILGQFQARHPETQAATTAYSVWDEVGMGFRMGSTDYLASRGIGAIPLHEGVRRFVELFLGDAGQRQVVITARLAGLRDTVHFLEMPTVPDADRFLEEITFICPGVEVTARAHLSLQRDGYLVDHNWKGSLLFPTVFGLEAMAQATAYVTGRRQFRNIQIDDIRLDRPIVVDPVEGTDIEVRAEVLERSSADAPLRVKLGIATESTGFSTDHFAAEFVLDEDMEPELEAVERPLLERRPLDVDPKRDLYGGLLFQGPRFQRLRQVCSLDSSQGVFVSETGPGDRQVAILGDPFFRDSLLHAVQVVVPQWIALPTSIERIRRYGLEDRRHRMLTVKAVNHGLSDGKAVFTVTAVDEDGRIVEQLDGYTLAVVDEHPENPAPEDFVNPSPRDEQLLRRRLGRLCEAFNVEVPELKLAYMPALHALGRDQRHQKELPLLIEAVRAAAGAGCHWRDASTTPGEEPRIEWLDSGKPVLTEGKGFGGLQLSLSHDEELMLCVSGRGPQGCDIHPVHSRTAEDWLALLSNARAPLLERLAAEGDSPDLAGTRVWSALEAFRKATGARDIDLRFASRRDRSVLFDGSTRGEQVSVLTFPAKLTLGPEKMVAVVTRAAPKAASEAAPRPADGTRPVPATIEAAPRPADGTRPVPATIEAAPPAETGFAVLAEVGFDKSHHGIGGMLGPRGERVMIVRWPLSFRDNRMVGGGIYFSNYFSWMGKVRELAVSPILDRLAEDMGGGQWGMVTNNASVRVLGDIRRTGVVEARYWMEGLDGQDDSTMGLRFQWRKVLPAGDSQRIADGKMQITWVRVLGHGQVEVAPLPVYVQDYVDAVGPRREADAPAEAPFPTELALGKELHRTSRGPRAGRVLLEEVFQTSLEDANLVGNIYFDNYAKWQGRVRDMFFYEAAPHLYRGGAQSGELVCRSVRVSHIREAMPFDLIYVSMGLRAVYQHGVKLEFIYYRINSDGSSEKLAFAEHEAVWVVRDGDGRPKASPLPDELAEVLRQRPADDTAPAGDDRRRKSPSLW